MIRKQQGDIQWLEFELLADFPELKHAIFLRHGGVSGGSYDSLNLSFTRGDIPQKVESNISKIKKLMAIDRLAAAEQIHKDGIIEVNHDNFETITQHDALMTNQQQIGLKVSHADCQAAIFYDPIRQAVATVHCGWRGHVCSIYEKVIAAMIKTYGSNPADLHVGISPSLSPQHAEFVNYRNEFPEPFWQFRVSENHFDLWALAAWQLKEAKISSSHIQVAEICTYANDLDCFSYRRGQRTTGAHGTVAVLCGD
jgi:YfiH family protein